MDPGDVDLQAAMPILATHKAALDAVRRRFRGAGYMQAVRMMTAGRFEGELGADLHDFLTDTIMNGGIGVWCGLIDQGHDKYSVTVYEYCGLYWVHALEYDPIGYFRSGDAAIEYVMSAWDDVEETALPLRGRM
ncbi:hypothetical protein GCM10028796_51030 [Ramlibacter monticola]|uniref:Uncharacterized protein n=1 Tax=Ramlibacter monticola TaxID=1926872 RepID=A0A936ZCL5_9BURK|nr:hypothetical protein [Ramlibacter monticola]MBL0395306.1 hypothetical protein [Ramlibacter monticola]